MAYLTVYNRNALWKRLVIQINILKYCGPHLDGDEGWMLYAKADRAVTVSGTDVPVEIVGHKTRSIKIFFGTSWSVFL